MPRSGRPRSARRDPRAPPTRTGALSPAPHATQPPKYPPSSSACSGADAPPARSSTCPTGVPIAISSTHGSRTAPSTVTSIEPGSADVPTERNHGRAVAGDEREMRERLDVLHQRRRRVQASLGEPRRRRGGRGDAPLDPVHDRARLAGHEPVCRCTTLIRTRSKRARRRSATASSMISRTHAVHDDHRLPGAGHLRREYRAVEDQLR